MACAALYFARPLMVPIVTAFVLSVLLAPATVWLRRRHIPESLGALIAVLVGFSLFIGGMYLTVQPGAAWFEKLPGVVEQAKSKLISVQEAVSTVQTVSEQVNEIAELGDAETDDSVTLKGPRLTDSLVSSARIIVVQIIFTSVLTYFFLSSRRDFQRKMMLFRSNIRGMRQTLNVMRAVERQVGSYMLTMMTINIGLGAATAVAMWAIGMPSPLVWGGLAAILNFVPYLGPIALVALLSVTGLVAFDTAPAMLAPPLLYMTLNFIESNFVTPMLIGVRLTISPLAIILNISFWTWLWGPAGAVISIPILVIFKTICDHSDFLQPIGLMIGDADTFRPLKKRFLK